MWDLKQQCNGVAWTMLLPLGDFWKVSIVLQLASSSIDQCRWIRPRKGGLDTVHFAADPILLLVTDMPTTSPITTPFLCSLVPSQSPPPCPMLDLPAPLDLCHSAGMHGKALAFSPVGLNLVLLQSTSWRFRESMRQWNTFCQRWPTIGLGYEFSCKAYDYNSDLSTFPPSQLPQADPTSRERDPDVAYTKVDLAAQGHFPSSSVTVEVWFLRIGPGLPGAPPPNYWLFTSPLFSHKGRVPVIFNIMESAKISHCAKNITASTKSAECILKMVKAIRGIAVVSELSPSHVGGSSPHPHWNWSTSWKRYV